MNNNLDESIIFLNALLKEKEDYVVKVQEGFSIPLQQSCIDIANKLKDYDRPIKEQNLGLFCLCYYHRLVRPEKIDVSKIAEFVGEDMADDLELFACFNLDESGVRSLGASLNAKESDKDYMWWLFMAINDVVFKNPYVDGFKWMKLASSSIDSVGFNGFTTLPFMSGITSFSFVFNNLPLR